ncbi:MAG: flagellar assembly protein FliW [Lachnospiraceae bacterium]|nr:flagellar assembly protein FliW [Lachnospiraceae bacterium]
MVIKTKCFGEVEIDDGKVVEFETGLLGFEQYKRYTLIFDSSSEEQPVISWLQCVDEPTLALPVINPFIIKEDYNPVVEDEVFKSIGDVNDENLAVFIVLTVPANIENMTANLRAPILINSDTRKGCQIIVENQEYQIRYEVYETLVKNKEKEE